MAKNIKSRDDKVLIYYYKTLEFFEKNKKNVYIGLVVLAVIIAGLVIYMNNLRAANEEATLELTKVQPVYDQGAFEQAINGDTLGASRGLLFIVNEFGSTESGNTAKLLLANSYYALMDFENARKYYNDYSGKNEVYKAASIAGIGAVYEAQGSHDEAGKQFEKAANLSSEIAVNDEYLYYAARNYSRAGNKDAYTKVLNRLKQDYPKSSYVAQAERYKNLVL